MTTFIVWLAILMAAIAAIYWFNVPAILKVVVSAVTTTVRLHMKFVAAWWFLITTRR